jgi:hypothetical protein
VIDMAKSKFKIGDKVISKEAGEWTEGLTGTIIPSYEHDRGYVTGLLVQFSKKDARGNGHNIRGEDGSNWYCDAAKLQHADTFTIGTTSDLAADINLPERLRKVLGHLKAGKRITNVEGQTVYGEYRLSDVIHKLRGAGYAIDTTVKKDEAGRKYSSYKLAA